MKYTKYTPRYNQRKQKITYIKKRSNHVGLWMMIATASFTYFMYSSRPQQVKLVSPKDGIEVQASEVIEPELEIVEASAEPEISPKDISVYIDQAVQEFLPTHYSESMMIMHCLAHRENGHYGNPGGKGDGGLAAGPFQFHQDTWERMRKQMIKEGVATEMSDRMNLKEATRTTAWAISKGRALEWGPILRDSKGSDFASCQTPSWYK